MVLSKDEMFLYEQVDIEALRLIKDNFDELYDSGKLGRFVDAKNGYSVIRDKGVVYDMIKDFYKTRKKTERQNYKYASGIKWGRMFSDGICLQGISRVIRQTISKDLYWDIDITNAHPVILLKYCQTHKLQVPVLKRYIEKRDELLAELMSYGISRDEAKTIPLAIINGGLRSGWFVKGEAPDWIVLLEKEVKDVYNHFRDTDKGKKFHRRAVSKKDNNVEGSTLNYFLCEQENEILCCMYKYLQEAGLRVGVFCFDGCMVYKKWDDDGKLIPFADKHLRGMEDAVREELHYDLKIAVKPMTEAISLEGLSKKDEPVFKMTHRACSDIFYDSEGADALVFTPQSGWFRKISSDETVIYKPTSIEDKLLLHIQDVLIPVMTKSCELCNVCLDDKEAKSNTRKLECLENLSWTEAVEKLLRQKYKRDEIFEPNIERVSEGSFNIFTGLAGSIEPLTYREDYIAPFVNHIRYICGESSDYVLNWISHIIQKPWEKNGTCIVITSRFQGNGKDTIAEMIKALVGRQYATKPDNLSDGVFGRFNGNLRHKFLCHLPEVKGSDIKPFWNRFKEFIVSDTDTTQFKGLDSVETKSYVRYFITSNDNNPVPVEQNDRRFNYIETEAEPQDKAYYDILYDLLNKQEAIRCLFKYFAQRDISQVDWKKDRVQSASVQDLKIQNTPLTTLFLSEFFEDGNTLLDGQGRVSNSDLWTAYINYCAKVNIPHKLSNISFSMALNKHSERYGMKKVVYWGKVKTERGFEVDLEKMEKELIKDGVLNQDEQEAIKSLLRGRK
jgi:hypothetical protein